jgi:hypothetical protein
MRFRLALLLPMSKIRRTRARPLAPKEGDILPERHILTIGIPECLTNLRAVQALDASYLHSAVIHNRSTNFNWRGVVEFIVWRMLVEDLAGGDGVG